MHAIAPFALFAIESFQEATGYEFVSIDTHNLAIFKIPDNNAVTVCVEIFEQPKPLQIRVNSNSTGACLLYFSRGVHNLKMAKTLITLNLEG
jgi:hypothetical protein